MDHHFNWWWERPSSCGAKIGESGKDEPCREVFAPLLPQTIRPSTMRGCRKATAAEAVTANLNFLRRKRWTGKGTEHPVRIILLSFITLKRWNLGLYEIGIQPFQDCGIWVCNRPG
jgi:hypothetical protein